MCCYIFDYKNSWQLLRRLGYRPTIWENIFFYKFLGSVFSGNTRKKCAGVYEGIPMLYFGGYMYCTHNMFTVSFFNGLCTSNMFMVLQIVVLWLYMSYKFCVIIFDYKNIFYSGMGWAWVNQHSMHLHCVTLSKMPVLVDDYHISKTPVELPTFLFCGNYRSPSFAFQHQHLS